ncbi:hypothetical protein M407DRAFT_242887 [Tulasnella calospora MUT 4182]|uniref:Uncharacterized protein n=1 Tax=Tulasnella calospora MUT 4182 TaxID=1051891 RepID=A0A0C3M4Q6_9AGAM|nr:hypothetical protein M407DRAFT_242887 [Tulasnella calospora MUT 4182]
MMTAASATISRLGLVPPEARGSRDRPNPSIRSRKQNVKEKSGQVTFWIIISRLHRNVRNVGDPTGYSAEYDSSSK